MNNELDRDNAVDLGILKTEVTYLKSGMVELKASQTQQNAKLDTIINVMAEARGSWKTLLLLGGAAGSVGACVPWVLSHFRG